MNDEECTDLTPSVDMEKGVEITPFSISKEGVRSVHSSSFTVVLTESVFSHLLVYSSILSFLSLFFTYTFLHINRRIENWAFCLFFIIIIFIIIIFFFSYSIILIIFFLPTHSSISTEGVISVHSSSFTVFLTESVCLPSLVSSYILSFLSFF